MSNGHLSIDIGIDIAGVEIGVTVDLVFRPGDPGRTSGPPENCYPPEAAEIDIFDFELRDLVSDDVLETPKWLWEIVYDALYEEPYYSRLLEKAGEAWRERE